MKETERPICCRCLEDFPVAAEPCGWRMGELRLKTKTRIARVRQGLSDTSRWLCGNCYFDLTDE